MRRVLAAAALVAALAAGSVLHAARTTPLAPVRAPNAGRAPPFMRDAAAIVSLRSIAAIGAGQARTLRAVVRRCRSHTARGQCVLMALERAAAGAKLSGVVLRAIAARLRVGRCSAIESRLEGLVATIDWFGVDGVQSRTWPGYTWAAARAAVRVGGRIIAVHDGPWPRRCMRIRPGLSA